MAIATLTETGLPNLSPARIDLNGTKSGYANHDYFQEIDLDVSDGTNPTEDLNLSIDNTGGGTPATISTFHLYLKRNKDDADADAVSAGDVSLRAGDTDPGDTGKITIHFPRIDLQPADAGLLYWSLAATVIAGNYVVPLAYGQFELRASPLATIA